MDFAAPPTWAQGSAAYLGEYGKIHLAPASRKRMSIVLEQFGNHLKTLGIDTVQGVERKHVEAYQLARVQTVKHRLKCPGSACDCPTISKATVNSDLRHLRSFLHRAKLEGWTDHVATDGVKMIRLARKHSKYRDEHELVRIIGALQRMKKKDILDLLLVVANTGIRLGEALAMRVDDVLREKAKLRVRVDEGFMPKGREERLIPLNVVALAALDRRILKAGRKPGALLWPFGQPRARKYLRLAAALAGVPHTTWHSIRHTFASVTAARIPEQALMAICGWQDSRTANQHYIHRRIMDLPPPPTVVG